MAKITGLLGAAVLLCLPLVLYVGRAWTTFEIPPGCEACTLTVHRPQWVDPTFWSLVIVGVGLLAAAAVIAWRSRGTAE